MSGDESGFGGVLAAAEDAEPAASVDVVARRLRKQFEARLASDPQFAADSRARLRWFLPAGLSRPEFDLQYHELPVEGDGRLYRRRARRGGGGRQGDL